MEDDNFNEDWLERRDRKKNKKSYSYSGRLGIHEVFIINDEIRWLISRDAPVLEINQSAKKYGFKPMRYDGIKKVLRGLTTIDEVNRVTLAE